MCRPRPRGARCGRPCWRAAATRRRRAPWRLRPLPWHAAPTTRNLTALALVAAGSVEEARALYEAKGNLAALARLSALGTTLSCFTADLSAVSQDGYRARDGP